MKEPNLDTETIAALLAGKLGDPERAAALEKLASSRDDFRLFIETAAVLREIEEEEEEGKGENDKEQAPRRLVAAADAVESADAAHGEAGAPATPAAGGAQLSAPPSVTRPRWRQRRAGVGLAAILATALAVLVLVVLPRRPEPRVSLSAPAALLSRPVLSRETLENRPWSLAMGSQAALAEPARAARVGALHTDFEVALRARDTSAVTAVVVQIDSLLASLPVGGREVVRAYRSAGDAAGAEPARAAALLRRAAEHASARFAGERGWIEAGAWAEGGRIAADGRDAAFFAAPPTRAALTQVGRLRLDKQGETALKRARTEIRPGRAPRWEVLEPAMSELLAALGN